MLKKLLMSMSYYTKFQLIKMIKVFVKINPWEILKNWQLNVAQPGDVYMLFHYLELNKKN